MSNDLLCVDNMSFSYGNESLLEKLSFSIEAGENVVLYGLNGSGKTTLLSILLGMIQPSEGSVTYNEKSVADLSSVERARIVTLVPQRMQDVFPFTVKEYILSGRYIYMKASHSFDRDEHQVTDIIKRLGLEALMYRSILALSGGERRKVEIARALCQDSKIVLFDEPFVFLDIREKDHMKKLLHQLQQEHGFASIVVTHEESVSANRFFVLNKSVVSLSNREDALCLLKNKE